MFERYAVTYELDSFISHNGQTADPLNKFSKALKEISGRRKKTDADFEKMAQIEKEAGLYLNDKGEITIDTRVIEATLLNGARKSKEGKDSLSAIFVDESSPIEFDGSTFKKPLTVAEVLADPRFHRTDAVKVGQSKVMRTRPFFKNVKGSFILTLDSDVANPEQMERWVHAAITQVGMGDWRPRHGRGRVISIKKLKS